MQRVWWVRPESGAFSFGTEGWSQVNLGDFQTYYTENAATTYWGISQSNDPTTPVTAIYDETESTLVDPYWHYSVGEDALDLGLESWYGYQTLWTKTFYTM